MASDEFANRGKLSWQTGKLVCMQETNLTRRYADLSSRKAVAVAGVCLLAMCACLTASFVGERRAGILQQGGRDLQAYRNIITRVHAGEDYYSAAGEELRSNGYPTGSLFNWRPPAYAWLIGSLPSPTWGQVLLCGLALITLLLAYNVMQRDGKAWRAGAA